MKSVDGMSLPNFRAGRVCDHMVQDVFAAELAPRSELLVENVRKYMQEVVTSLWKAACNDYPSLWREMMRTGIIEEFMEALETRTKEAVLNICRAELVWTFTQNPAYEKNLETVAKAIEDIHKAPPQPTGVARDQHGNLRVAPSLNVKAVGAVPKGFMEKMLDCATKSEEDNVRTLQVSAVRSAPDESHILCCSRVCFQRICTFCCDYNVEQSVSGA